jgi:hypothetical protein
MFTLDAFPIRRITPMDPDAHGWAERDGTDQNNGNAVSEVQYDHADLKLFQALPAFIRAIRSHLWCASHCCSISIRGKKKSNRVAKKKTT